MKIRFRISAPLQLSKYNRLPCTTSSVCTPVDAGNAKPGLAPIGAGAPNLESSVSPPQTLTVLGSHFHQQRPHFHPEYHQISLQESSRLALPRFIF